MNQISNQSPEALIYHLITLISIGMRYERKCNDLTSPSTSSYGISSSTSSSSASSASSSFEDRVRVAVGGGNFLSVEEDAEFAFASSSFFCKHFHILICKSFKKKHPTSRHHKIIQGYKKIHGSFLRYYYTLTVSFHSIRNIFISDILLIINGLTIQI